MPKLSHGAFEEVHAAMEEYKREVLRSRLAKRDKAASLLHVSQFVLWLMDEFAPNDPLS